MPRIRRCFEIALLAALAAGPSWAKDEDSDELADSEMLSAMKEAEASTLDSALQRSGRDAQTSLEYAEAFLYASGRNIRVALKEVRSGAKRQEGLEEDVDALLLSSQMFDAKSKAFRLKASSAALSAGQGDEEALSSRRASYRSKDRSRDLTLSEGLLEKAAARFKRPAELGKAESELIEALQGCISESRGAAEALKRAGVRAAGQKKKAPNQFAQLIERLEEDGEGLAQEVRLLESALKMRALDEQSFAAEAR